MKKSLESVGPDYSYAHGIRFDDQAPTPLSTSPVFADPITQIARIHAEKAIEKPLKIHYRDGERRIIGALAVIEPLADTDQARTIVFNPAWGTTFGFPILTDELALLHAERPNERIVVPAPFGSDRSLTSPIPRAMMKKVIKTGSFLPVGDMMAESISDLGSSEGWGRSTFIGASLGGRLAIAQAASESSRPHQVVAFDPPGSRDMGLPGIASAFMLKEGGHAGEYKQSVQDAINATEARIDTDLAPDSPEATKAKEMELTLTAQKTYDQFDNVARRFRLGNPVQLLLRQPQAMSRVGLEADLQALRDSHPGADVPITIISPTMSEINRTDDLERIAASIGGIAVVRFLDQTHSYAQSRPEVTLRMLQHTLRD